MSAVEASRTVAHLEQIRLNGTAVNGANLVAVQLDDMPILLDERREVKVDLDMRGEGAARRQLSGPGEGGDERSLAGLGSGDVDFF
jgi:hypothetical protein